MLTKQKKLPDVDWLRNKYPLGDELNKLKLQFDGQIKDNLVNRSKLTVVCGPCAADSYEAVREYL